MMTKRRIVYDPKQAKRYRFPTHINDLVIDRRDTECSEVFVVVLAPEEKPPLHVHKDMEQIFYILQGIGMLSLGKRGERKFPVRKGQVVYIPRAIHHSVKNEGAGVMKYLTVDVFTKGIPKKEPTWDVHVNAACRHFGWDARKVSKGSGNK